MMRMRGFLSLEPPASMSLSTSSGFWLELHLMHTLNLSLWQRLSLIEKMAWVCLSLN